MKKFKKQKLSSLSNITGGAKPRDGYLLGMSVCADGFFDGVRGNAEICLDKKPKS